MFPVFTHRAIWCARSPETSYGAPQSPPGTSPRIGVSLRAMNTPSQRRRKVPATVAPSKLVNALDTKLSAARRKVLDLQRAEEPRVDGISHHDLVIHFLKAARGVYPVVKTFHDAWLQGHSFEAWLTSWEQGLIPADLALWQYMQDQRDRDEHGDGADLVSVDIPVMLDHQQPYNAALYGVGPEGQPKASKGSVRFGKYPHRRVSEVCAEYLTLCQRFMDDYLREPVHAATIRPSSVSGAAPVANATPGP